MTRMAGADCAVMCNLIHTHTDEREKRQETSRRCLDNGLVTGMFTSLVCTKGKRKRDD